MGREHRAATLHAVGSCCGSRTMMQPCASVGEAPGWWRHSLTRRPARGHGATRSTTTSDRPRRGHSRKADEPAETVFILE